MRVTRRLALGRIAAASAGVWFVGARAFARVQQSAPGASPLDSDVSVSDPASGALRLTAFSACYLTTSPPASSVLIGVEVDGLADIASAAREGRELQLVVNAPSVSTTITVPLTDPDVANRASREGLRVLARLPFGLGLHELRISATDTGDRRSGSVVRAIDVPSFVDQPITMSHLALTASRVSGVSHMDGGIDELLPIIGRPPTGRRVFARSEQVEVNAEIYTYQFDPAGADDACFEQMRIYTIIEAPDGRVVFESSDVGQSETLPSGVYGYEHYALVPVATLAPGAYNLRVTVSDGTSTASRAVPITIVDAAR